MNRASFPFAMSLLLAAAGCNGSTSSTNDDAGGAHEGGSEGGGGPDGSSDDGGDAGCTRDSGGTPIVDGAVSDGACSGPGTSACYACCQASYPKGEAAYEKAYGACACSMCGGSCPVTCGCGTVEDDTCTNCINGYRTNDAGCFAGLDPACKADPDCNAFLSCVNDVCHYGF